MKYLLGVDFGGGASKATLLAETGVTAAAASSEYPTLYPNPGWTEQDPDEWYRAIKENIAAVLEKSGVSPADIAAVCLDAPTHTAVLCDRDGTVLRPAIYWTDARSLSEVAELREKAGDLILEQSLHKIDTIWTLPQLYWVKKNEPEVWEKTGMIFFAKDYLRYRLTGKFATDFIEAQGSMLFDCRKNCWSEELCGLIGLNMDLLPPLLRPSDIAGEITPSAAADLGLAAGTPVICGTTDTAMEVLASGAVNEGQMTVKLATAGRICVITDKAWPSRHLVNYSHVKEGLWYPGTATKAAASSYRWYRDTFGADYRALDEGAAAVPPGSEGLFYHPYISGELTPYADPLLRGSFVGIRAGHGRGHFSRAVLEGVGYSLLACKKELETLGIAHDPVARIIGGGGKSPLWRQIVADMLGIPLLEVENSDSSLGAAMLAGVACGIFADFDDAAGKCTRLLSRTEPDPETHAFYQQQYETYVRIHDALAPIYHG